MLMTKIKNFKFLRIIRNRKKVEFLLQPTINLYAIDYPAYNITQGKFSVNG